VLDMWVLQTAIAACDMSSRGDVAHRRC
jgi:hypothetical protein